MIQLQKLNKHDRYVLDLCDKIRERYDYLLMHYEIRNSKRSFGEIDVCAVKGNRVDIYEVKCSFRIHKAEKQLKRAKRLIHSNGYSYFYCGSSGQLQEIAA